MARELLHDVGVHAHRHACLEAGDGGLLQHLLRHVEEAVGGTAHHGLLEQDVPSRLPGTRGAWHADQLHVVIGVKGNIALGKLARSDAGVAEQHAGVLLGILGVLVASLLWGVLGQDWRELSNIDLGLLANLDLKVEGRGRLAQADGEHAVDVGHAGVLLCRKLLGAGAGTVSSTNVCGGATQQAIELGVHLGGAFGAGGLGHHVLRDKAPLGDKVHGLEVVAAVAHAPLEHMVELAVVVGPVDQRNHVVEHGVGLLELVVEHAKCLRELEGIDVEQIHRGRTSHVEGREHPAAPALTLVRDLTGALDRDPVGVVVGAHTRVVARGGHHVHGGHGVSCNSVGTLGPKGRPLLACPTRINASHVVPSR